jgi:diguanylate cyclase (GGDEF)-like protein
MNTVTTLAAAGGPLAAGWGAHASLLARRARLARRDPLTGLPTREEFTRRAARLMGRCPVAVVLVDLDGFKAVNDTHGHAAGDAVLVETADRLSSLIFGGVAARLGGDEFALVRPMRDGTDLPRALETMHGWLCTPVDAEGLVVGVSIGGVWSSHLPAPDLPLALRLADEAMYAAKRAGGGWRTGAPGLPMQATVNGRRAGREGAHGAGVAS